MIWRAFVFLWEGTWALAQAGAGAYDGVRRTWGALLPRRREDAFPLRPKATRATTILPPPP